jgi:hypothetical protein
MTRSRREIVLCALILATAILAVGSTWFLSQWNLVRQRREAWQEIEAAGGSVAATHPGEITGVLLPNFIHVSPRQPLPWARRVAGDLPVMAIILRADEPNTPAAARCRELFPEAIVIGSDDFARQAPKAALAR